MVTDRHFIQVLLDTLGDLVGKFASYHRGGFLLPVFYWDLRKCQRMSRQQVIHSTYLTDFGRGWIPRKLMDRKKNPGEVYI